MPAKVVEEYIPEPSIFLLGCQPWPPVSDDGLCPVCRHGIRPDDHHVYCGWSDETSPAREARIRAARLGVESRGAAEAKGQQARTKLGAARPVALSEADRRRIWNGYRKTLVAELVGDQVNNLARAGREWLTAIGQEPDWSLVLDARGRVVGRVDEDED